MVASNLNFILPVELEELGSGVGILEWYFVFTIGSDISRLVWRYGINVVNNAVERSFETIEHVANECEEKRAIKIFSEARS